MSRLIVNSEGEVPSQPTAESQTQSSSAIDFQPQVPPPADTVLSPSGNIEPVPLIDTPAQQLDDRLLVFRDSQTLLESWRKKSILTCDGGGIRGLGSLLIIQELMIRIGEIEQSLDYPDIHTEKHTSSFEPCEKPKRVKVRTTGLVGADGAYVNQYLPCHYFDLMVGTSTGGLIATMLSRLRMTVAEAVEQYEDVGKKIFENPRSISLVGWPKCKHSKKPLIRAIQDLVASRRPNSEQLDKSIFNMFPAPSDLCRTAVVAIQKGNITKTEQELKRTQDGTYLFRSYRPNDIISIDAGDPPLNWGPSNNHEIWKVCRATTAAPTYFEPQQIGDEEYCDGAAGVNNPTIEALKEMRRLHKKCVKTVVSVGTGKPAPSTIFGRRARRFERLNIGSAIERTNKLLHRAKAALTDCEKTHEIVEDRWLEARGTDAEFEYYRLNIEDGLGKVKLDEMKQRRDNGTGGHCTTIQYIRHCTNVELAKVEMQDRLTELAKVLVRQRRARANDDLDRWERFACCTFYKCCEDECRGTPALKHTFALKRQMRDHLLRIHQCPLAEVEVRVVCCRKEPEFHTGPY